MLHPTLYPPHLCVLDGRMGARGNMLLLLHRLVEGSYGQSGFSHTMTLFRHSAVAGSRSRVGHEAWSYQFDLSASTSRLTSSTGASSSTGRMGASTLSGSQSSRRRPERDAQPAVAEESLTTPRRPLFVQSLLRT